jgi:hypothetical protein
MPHYRNFRLVPVFCSSCKSGPLSRGAYPKITDGLFIVAHRVRHTVCILTSAGFGPRLTASFPPFNINTISHFLGSINKNL